MLLLQGSQLHGYLIFLYAHPYIGYQIKMTLNEKLIIVQKIVIQYAPSDFFISKINLNLKS